MTAGPGGHAGTSPLAWLLVAIIRAWRLVSQFATPRCRFYPSCSAYALQAIDEHGALRGSVLAIRRISRCHPFHPGGVDHVPQRVVRRAE